MFNNIFGIGAGASIPSNWGAGGGLGAQQLNPLSAQQAQNLANQQMGAYNAAAAQQQAASWQRQQQISQVFPHPARKRYMIDGKYMDFQEFVDTIYPSDCPEKTMLILKFSKGPENDN